MWFQSAFLFWDLGKGTQAGKGRTVKDWGLLGPEGELLGVALDRTVPFRDSANLASHMVIQRPFFSLSGVQKNTSQLPSVDKPFSHVLLQVIKLKC